MPLTLAATAAFSVPGVPDDAVILCNATSAAFTATLPDATKCPGVRRNVLKTDSSGNAVTIGTTSAQTILTTAGAVTTVSLAAQGNATTVVSNGTGWFQTDKV